MDGNFHSHDDGPAHRLLNVIEQEAYVRPYRHFDPARDEPILCLRGVLGCILFDDAGEVLSLHRFGPAHAGGIGRDQYHGLISLESGSVMFEARAGRP